MHHTYELLADFSSSGNKRKLTIVDDPSFAESVFGPVVRSAVRTKQRSNNDRHLLKLYHNRNSHKNSDTTCDKNIDKNNVKVVVHKSKLLHQDTPRMETVTKSEIHMVNDSIKVESNSPNNQTSNNSNVNTSRANSVDKCDSVSVSSEDSRPQTPVRSDGSAQSKDMTDSKKRILKVVLRSVL